MPVGFLQNNIDEVAKIYNLPNNHKITKTLISQIISTAKYIVSYGQVNGFPYPLLNLKDKAYNLIAEMSKFHHSIIVFNALQFINDLITKIEYQVRLNSFYH